MTVDNARHVVISACIGWGHLRGLCMLSSRFVKLRPSVNVTFFTSRISYDKVQAEISRDFGEDEQHLRDKIHVIALTENQEKPFDMELFDHSFIEQYRKLTKLEEVLCVKKNSTIATGGGRAPDTVILDLFAYSQFLAVRKAHPEAKILCWSPAPTSGLIPILGPFGTDTKGHLTRKVEKRMAETGEPFVEAAYNALALGLTDKVLDVPGIPAMYDHETAPQRMPIDDTKLIAQFFIAGADFYHDADGVITPTFAAFDPPETMAEMKKFFELTNRKFYVVGPLLPSAAAENAEKHELRQSPKSQETEAFLERILRTHGEKSLVYVSFGSTFWSSEPEKIWAFVDTLLEKKIPFIMAHASPFARVPEEIHKKVESSGLGLLTPWAPQQLILNSPVIGWFVTHCGVNSIIETISAGVPMIAWPFGAEQPLNAAHCSLTLNIAYELLEVRTGKSLKVYRTGKTHPGTVEDVRAEAAAILDKAFGPDGEIKRKNILKLREAAEQAWAEGGPGRTAVEELLAAL